MTRNKSPAGRAIRPRGGVAMRQQRQFRCFPSTPYEIESEALCGPLRGRPAISSVGSGKTCRWPSCDLYAGRWGFT